MNNGISETVPDQAMSVRTIMDRFSRGMPIGQQKTEIWDPHEDEFPDLDKMDLAERQEAIERLKDEAKHTDSKVAAHKKQVKEAAQDRLKREAEANEAKNALNPNPKKTPPEANP